MQGTHYGFVAYLLVYLIYFSKFANFSKLVAKQNEIENY